MATTALPKIASHPCTPKMAMTPVMTPRVSMTPISTAYATLTKSQSTPSLYGAYPPKELSSSMDLIRIPARINPLAPKPPKRRINMAWETVDQHYSNYKRSALMQRREHTRFHSAWERPFYGAPAEKEAYRLVDLILFKNIVY
jgi:hypothetical protein